MKKLQTQLVVFIFFSFSTNLLAEPKISDKYQPYKVEVNSVSAMFEHMKQHGLSDQNDYQFHGGSSWNIKWNYKTKERRSKCYLKNLKVKFKATHKLPELSAPLKEPLMQEAWNEYTNSLLKHQKKHVELALESARAFEKKVNDIKPQKNCSEFRSLIRDLNSEIKVTYNAKHQHYDATSDFGRKEGVTFDSFLQKKLPL